MKLSVLFLLITTHISASNYAQELITINVTKKNDVADILKKIEYQTDYRFYYSNDVVPRISFDSFIAQNASLNDVLQKLFVNTDIKWKIIGKTKVVLLKQEISRANFIPITGTVRNESGNVLVGVSVMVKRTGVGTVTSSTGTFTIDANAGDTLVFSIIGYQKTEVLVDANKNIDVVLKMAANNMDEVVVVGYGQSSRKNLSSSVVTVKPEELNRAVTGDVGQLLQGKVPGLNITASGDPNTTAAVVMRGASTINSPQGPFYVIDGIPGADISTVAPSDIASIDILKDAAATAIYGNKASNGVIIITTQKGKSGKSQTAYNGYVGLEKVSGSLDVMNAGEIKSYVTENGNSILPADDLGANTDWMKAIERSQAISQNHNLSFSGGNNKSTYSASVDYLDKQGILLKSELNRVIARLNLNHKALQDKLKLGLNITTSNSKAKRTPLRNVVLQQAAKHLAVSPVYNEDGTYFENFNTPGYFNPVSLINNAKDDTKYNTLLGNFTAEATLPWGFKYNLNLAYQKNTSLHGEYYNSYYSDNYKSGFYSNPDPGFTNKGLITFGENGAAYRSSYENNSTTLESYLTWNKNIKEHAINAVLGYSWQENNSGDGLQASNTNFVSDYTGYYNMALGNYQSVSGYTVNFGSTLYQTTRFISDFLRVNYSFADKYLLQASVRRDGSSVFGTNNQWGYFPAVGLAWRIDQEKFMKNVSFVNDLKLRVSYGQTGNAFGFGAYTAKQLFSSYGTYYNNGVYETAIGVTQGSNPDLKWEITSTSNIGLDFGLFNRRLWGSLDLYEKITTDMIFAYTVSSTIVPGGYVWGNGGKVRNRGVELNLSSDIINGKSFTWNTTLNLALNKNRILDMHGPDKYGVNSDSIRYTQPDGAGQTNSTLQILKVGHAIGEFFTLKYAGKDASGNSQFYTHDGSLTTSPSIGTDYFYAGSPHPKLLAGWSNTLSYKNFDLNFFFRGAFGAKIFNATRADLSYTVNASANNISKHAADDLMTDAKNNAYSTRYIENGSYIRLDNATLSYRLPLKPGSSISKLRFYLTANNLFLITSYTGIDPEINQGGVGLGVDASNFYPKTRTAVIGVNIGF